MYAGDLNHNHMDHFSHSNIFNMNESQNIWSTNDKSFLTSESLFSQMRQKNTSFTSSSFVNSNVVTDRTTKPRKAAASERRDTNLIVNYLPDGFYEKDLHDLFSKAGPIAHYHVVRNKENRSECYGFVDFEKPLDAERAIEMFHQFQIQNKKLKVQNAYEGLLIKQEEKERTEKGLTNLGYNVEVKNAPFRWTTNDVKNIFGKYGEVLKVGENAADEKSVNSSEIRSKTFNVVYRYQTIATKVVKRKHKQFIEPLWPLDLEVTLTGQEIVDVIPEPRCRSRNSKQKFDQLSETSYDSKFPQLDPKSLVWDDKFDMMNKGNGEISYWSEDSMVPNINGTLLPLSSNGRPILKHKDNISYSNENSDSFSDPFFKSISEMNTKPETRSVMDGTLRMSGDSNSFYNAKRMMLHDNSLKNIWEPNKDARSPVPTDMYVKTPLIPYLYPSTKKGRYKANIWLKMENTQPTGSFKLRGMAQVVYKAKWDNVSLVISSSGGNAGLAVAYVCNLLKMRCTIVVPVTTAVPIIELMTRNNAQVIQEGANWQEAHTKAELIRDSYPGLCRLVHPYDDPLLWHGYESIIDEIVDDMNGNKLDLIVCAVGGGGLLNGIAQGISKHNLNKQTAILAMETEGTSCFNKSMYAEDSLAIVPEGVATSLGASKVSQKSMEIFKGQDHHLFSMVCTDTEAIESCIKFIYEHNAVVEPACGAALSTMYNGYLEEMAECRSCDLNIVVIVCGGRCTDIDALFQMKQMIQQHQNEFVDSHQNRQVLDINVGRMNALEIGNNAAPVSSLFSQNNANTNGVSQGIRTMQDMPSTISNDQYFFSSSNTGSNTTNQNLPSVTSTSKATSPLFTYSSVASKNLGPIREHGNTTNSTSSKTNILTISSNSNRSNAMDCGSTVGNSSISSSMISSTQSSYFHNNSSTVSSNKISLLSENGISSSGVEVLTGANAASVSTSNFVPFSSSSDMIASPVGSQHSDKENRF